jgi:cell division transport system ATP-binding protein
MIKFENVTKKFGPITALSEVSFEINDGEFIFLTGPSGAGKTTIFKLILREYLPTEGKVFVEEKDLSQLYGSKVCRHRREIGVVFQDFKLLADRKVSENVALPLEIKKVPQSEITRQLEEVLSRVGLLEREGLFPAQLAGGELQRTALARAIITKPEILLADEPTGNLDPKTALQLVELFRQINKDGTTVIMATHNAKIVNSFRERVIELGEGKMVRDEPEGKYEVEESEKEDEKAKKKGK